MAPAGHTSGPGAADEPNGATPRIPKEFAEAPAVVLRESRSWRLDNGNKAVQESVQQRILLQSSEGFTYADQSIVYDASRSSISGFLARTILPDGSAIEIPADLKRDSVLIKDDQREIRILQFTFPAVEAGAVVEWEYQLAHRNPPPVQWWEVQRSIPVLESRFKFEVDRQNATLFRNSASARLDYGKWCELKPRTGAVPFDVEEMICRSVPAYQEEPFSPPENDVRLRILMSWSFSVRPPNERIWDSVQTYYLKRVTECTQQRRKVRQLVAEILPAQVPPPVRVDKLSDWVRRNITIREQEFSGGLDGLEERCRNPDAVLESRGGLPAEVTLLTMALLQEAGVTVNPVLVGDRSQEQFDTALPDLSQADHLLLQVITGTKEGYIDPSCRFCQTGIPDWRRCGIKRSGLRVSEMTAPDTVEVPLIAAEFNSERWSSKVKLGRDGSGEVRGRVIWQAQVETALREAWEDLTEAGRREAFLMLVGGEVEDPVLTPSDPELLDEQLNVAFEYRQPGMAIPAGDRLLLRPLDVFAPRLAIPSQEAREHPLWRPYAHSIRSEVSWALPDGLTVVELPHRVTLEGPGLRFDALWSKADSEAELKLTALLLIKKTRIEVEDYPRAVEFAAALRRFLSGGIVLGPGGSSRRTADSGAKR